LGITSARARLALPGGAVLISVLALAACKEAPPESPVVQRAEAAVRKATPNPQAANFFDIYQCGGAEAAMGDVSLLNQTGDRQTIPFVYANGKVVFDSDADAFIRLTAVCKAALRTQLDALDTNRAAINAALVKEGVNPDGPRP
jgi:hypothetical protein